VEVQEAINVTDRIIKSMLDDIKSYYPPMYQELLKDKKVREATSSEMSSDPQESFEGWLSLSVSNGRFYSFTNSELKTIRDAVRSVTLASEICKNVLFHCKNHLVGEGLQLVITAVENGEDPTLIKDANDKTIETMKTNWRLFTQLNDFDSRMLNFVERSRRDGEAFFRFFDTTAKLGAPTIRFIGPEYIKSTDPDAPFGILFDPNDAETAKKYFYDPTNSTAVPGKNDKEKGLPPEDIIHYKRNVDMEAPRGIPDFWPVMTNIRRAEKLLTNISVLTTIQSAIALVRRHENANQSQVKNLINRQSDGVTRTDSNTGKTISGRKLQPGTVLDAPKGIEYDFPAHNINVEGFIAVVDKELAHIAANFVQPVEWLLAKEPAEPLSPGSPTMANFRTEQAQLFNVATKIFWKVQEMMGVDPVTNKQLYDIEFSGPILAIGKALDDARVQQILVELGGTSPQLVAARYGNNWRTVRKQTLEHIKTLTPGEAPPGSVGAAVTANDPKNDGMTKADGKVKKDGSTGGNNNM
jgi:hypothetical protein